MPRVRTFDSVRKTRERVDRAIAAVSLSLICVLASLAIITMR
jgi:hypothetical protein